MDFSANRDGIRSLWRRLAALLVVVLASGAAQADWVYGPPYSYNTAWGSEGGFLSVDAAVNSLIGGYEADCNNGSLECGPHSFSVAYGGSHSGTAATITITYVHSDGTSSSDLFGYIWAEDVTGSGFQPKNAGGCRTMCTAGNGSGQDSMGPRGSSGNGTIKRQDADRGTSLEGDPINAANGNEYRQDTDVTALSLADVQALLQLIVLCGIEQSRSEVASLVRSSIGPDAEQRTRQRLVVRPPA